ncbi:MAG: protein kinase domain-containing protein [Ktedonobacteraceae bacterium]
MECPYCNAENRDGVHFCSNCGKPLTPTITASSTSTGSANTNSRTLTPGSRLQGGRYIIKKMLGQGGMGAAMLATDIRLDSKSVVLKELISDNTDPARLQEDVRNFKREVATLAHLDHPLIPNVTDHFQEGSRYFMVQEYAEGENLEERMDRVNQPMMEREALGYTSEVLDILDYLAQETPPIVHRDIKPANIIIGNKDKRVHLVDFGIARADVTRNAQRKQTSALGTPGYAPPEQYQGNADPRSDLYALAATLHHLLTNRDPRNHPPFIYPPVRTLNPQLSPDIERVLTRALTNDINQRYQSAAAMKRDIDDILLKRFGVSGNVSSYTLGTSGPMSTVSAASAPTAPYQPAQRQQQSPPRQAPPLSYPPPPPPPPQSIRSRPAQQQRRGSNYFVLSFILLLLVVLVIGAGLFAIPYLRNLGGQSTGTPGSTAVATATGLPANGIGAFKAPDGEFIGVSDGTIAFAVSGTGGTYKTRAATSLKAGDSISAESLWRSALANDSGDAESLIYLEDQRVLDSNSPYITIVVGTMLTGDNATVGRDDLQGAYVLQKEFNDGHKLTGGRLVRLLVANSGNQTAYATTVAQQIVNLANHDSTFAGVMGWPFSSRAQAAINTLARAHIPMVSQTASSDSLSGISPYFFRVAPPNKTQGVIGATYAEQVLHAKTAVLFVDPADPYSQSLANDFSSKFTADGNQIVKTEEYTVGQKGQAALPQLLQDAESKNPDMIYFSGYAADISTLLTNLPTSGQFANLPVMGGDALYELGYPSSARAGFSHLHFTSFAYPDEWDNQHLTAQKPAFFNDYVAAFNPDGKHPGGQYGFTRADGDVILSYDALFAFLTASNNVLKTKQNFTPDDIRKALLQITGSKAIQGVSGQISFGSNGDPINKAIVVLFVDPNGHIRLDSVQGCFLVGKCS